ncbi:MAG TPA: ATP-binding protein [Bacteroidia bacterium]|nr:ATP-binding protein [Bacteroidia bacterium]
MKWIFRKKIWISAVALLIISCSTPGSEYAAKTNTFSNDTVTIRQLLDSFDLALRKNEIQYLYGYADRAKTLAENINYEDGMAESYKRLGNFFGILGDYPKNLEYQLSALKLNEKNNIPPKIARNLSDIGIVHYSQNNFSEAMRYFEKALRINQQLGKKDYVATAHFLIALCLDKLTNDSSALEYFFKSLAVQKELGELQRMAECEQAIGDIYLNRKEYSEALKFYNSSYHHFEEAGESMGYAAINVSMAKLFLESGQFDKAEKHALSAADYFRTLPYRTRVIDAYEILHKIFAAQHKFDKAYSYQTKLGLLRDSVQGEQTARRIDEMLNAHEMDKKQIEIELQQRQIKTTRTLRNFFMIGFCIVALLAFLTFRQYKIKKQTAQKLEETIEHLEAAQEQLVYSEKMSSLGKLSAGIAHEIQNPLNFVNNFSDIGVSLIDELETIDSAHKRKEILSDLKNNLRKIHEHGKRADGIVKSMLEHMHIGSREKRPTDLNYLANEFFTLAFQSFKAKEPGFVCHVEKLFDSNLPMVNINPQDISRVMINLFNNALYALNKKKITDGVDFSPSIVIQSRFSGNRIYFSVKDNGTGIPKDIREQIFQPFFTTKSSGEGTGLGLSLSNDIITKGHGGTLEVKTEVGEGSEFIISLPV